VEQNRTKKGQKAKNPSSVSLGACVVVHYRVLHRAAVLQCVAAKKKRKKSTIKVGPLCQDLFKMTIISVSVLGGGGGTVI